MLDQVLVLFEIVAHVDLDLMEDNQSLSSLTARAIGALTEMLEKVSPSLVLVQGDTTTAVVAGLADALRREGVPADSVFVTGNPVVDALRWIVARPPRRESVELLRALGIPERRDEETDGIRTILVTAHRRENFGPPLAEICGTLRALVRRNRDVRVVYPVHRNPNVRCVVHRLLDGEPGVHLLDPHPYEAFVQLMARSFFVITDSGGLQEEAPAFGKPVLVLRGETERPEGIEAGVAKLVGTSADRILPEAERLLHDRDAYQAMACAISPYGDGQAAERIVRIILERYV